MLPLALRTALSHIVIFKSTNTQECKAIKDELMNDLDKEDQELLLEHCWKRPYGFTFIDVNAQKNKRYHSNFDAIEI